MSHAMDRVRRALRQPGPVGYLTILLMFSLFVIQTWDLFGNYIRPRLQRAWQLREMPAWERTAHLLEGERVAGHLGFLRENVPPDAYVILPPRTRFNAYEHIGFMQYFLVPRTVANCGHAESDTACVERLGSGEIYILGLDYFPPREPTLRTKKFLEYQGDLGVFVPR